MSVNWTDKDLGVVSAFGVAKEHGWTGTEAEWEALQAAAPQAGSDAEAYGAGTRSGSAVGNTDPAYQNNSKYYKEQAAGSATAAAASAAEAAQYTSDAVHTWLDANIDPDSGYALDRTLSEPLEAAPADLVGDIKSALDGIVKTCFYRSLVLNKGGVSRADGTQELGTTNRLRTTYIEVNCGDIIEIPAGYYYSFFYYKYVGTTFTYVGNSYDEDGWYNERTKTINFTGMVIVVIAKTDYADFTENECYALNNQITLYSATQQKVSEIPFFAGHISISSNSNFYTLIGNDHYAYSIGESNLYLNTTRFSSGKFVAKKGCRISVAAGYRFYIMKFVSGSATILGWFESPFVFSENSEIRLIIDKTAEAAHAPYTTWPLLNEIVFIHNNEDIIRIDEAIDDLQNGIINTEEKELYIGELINGHLVASGVIDDEYTDYRISSTNIIALPCGSKRELKVRINSDYLFAIRSGVEADDINHNQFWLADGDVITIPDGDNYYAVSICNVAGDGGTTHKVKTISPTENTGLHVLFENAYDILMGNDESEKIIASARLYFSQSNPNTLERYPVIAHTSDCHGDYQRVENFMRFCDSIGVDAACITGDIVAYNPGQGIEWFADILNNHSSLPAICTGNHDVYNNDMDDDDIYDFMFAGIAEKIGNTTEETWYCKDISAKKIRLISVNLYQYGGSSRWHTHYTSDQLSWLVSTLKNTPQDYGVIILSHSPQVSLENAKDTDYPAFFQNVRLYNNTMNDVSGGVPIYDIVDAFIARSTLSKTYTQTGSPSSVTVTADFSTGVNTGVEFIAHLTGHFHEDSVCYVPGTVQKQLMLNVICTNSLYGGSSYPYLSDLSDVGRNKTDATQDAFNVYVIDRDKKTVRIVRVGQNVTYDMTERTYMEIPYADVT